jgi:uncharacterized protein (TIGR02118 family)
MYKQKKVWRDFQMVKVAVVLAKPTNEEEFQKHYYGVHVPLIKALPNVKNVNIKTVFQAQNYYIEPALLAEFEFDSQEQMESSLSSPQGEQLYADVDNLVPLLTFPPMITFSN